MPEPDGVISYPGRTGEMTQRPHDEMHDYVGRGLLEGKRALITGGRARAGRQSADAVVLTTSRHVIGVLGGRGESGDRRNHAEARFHKVFRDIARTG